jgi:hypothetical protein
MMLVKAKEIAINAAGGVNVAESVLAVPFWFTDAQRRGILRFLRDQCSLSFMCLCVCVLERVS